MRSHNFSVAETFLNPYITYYKLGNVHMKGVSVSQNVCEAQEIND